MDPRIDLELENNAIVIQDSDVLISESDEQHIQDTISAFPGWWKENPADGVGVISFLKSRGIERILSKKINLHLSSDLYFVNNPEISFSSNGTLNIKPNASLK